MNKRVKIETPPEEFVDPKLRMKQIRQEVRDYLSGKHGNPWGISHLGELPQTMEDARRVIIALQDMLDERIQKHNKASDHIRNLNEEYEMTAEYVEELSDLAVTAATEMMGRIHELEGVIKDQEAKLNASFQERCRLASDLQTMIQKVFQRDQDVAALKHTIKLTLGA